MKSIRRIATTLGLTFSLLVSVLPNLLASSTESKSQVVVQHNLDGQPKPKIEESYGKLPLSFEPNKGQAHRSVKFVSRGSGYVLFLSAAKASLALHSSEHLRMNLIGANIDAPVSAEVEQEGRSNYLIGTDRSKWHTDIPNYSRVRVTEAYPGIDVLYYGSDQQRLEFDFVVAPGARTEDILLNFEGAKSVSIDPDGSLRLKLNKSEVVQPAPVIYQTIEGERKTVAGRFNLVGPTRVKFEIGDYDRDRELVIDPQIIYASYHGGTNDDRGNGVAVDKSGNAYIVGSTRSTNLNVTGGVQNVNEGGVDAFIVKINSRGTQRIFSTYLGGNGTDVAHDVAIASDGKICVTGSTEVDTINRLPTTSNSYNGNSGFFGLRRLDVFVTVLTASGNGLFYSTFLGGNDNDIGNGIALDAANKIYVSGNALSPDFPRKNSNQGRPRDHEPQGFVAKIDPTESGNDSLVYSSVIHGEGSGRTDGGEVAVTSDGVAFTMGTTEATSLPVKSSSSLPPFQSTNSGGQDIYVAKVSSNGTLDYLTYFGGDGSDAATGIAVDENERVYLTGSTNSTSATFPLRNSIDSTRNAGTEGFVAKLNADGTTLFYSTFFSPRTGGNAPGGIAVDAGGDVYIAGGSTGTALLSPVNGFQSNAPDGGTFVAKFERTDATGTNTPGILYFDSTGSGQPADIALDRRGNVYFAGSISFQMSNVLTNGVFQPTFSAVAGNDAYIIKVNSTFAETIGVFRSTTRQFLIRNSNSAGAPNQIISFGAQGDIPVVGDWNGDGSQDFAVFRPSAGQFLIRTNFLLPGLPPMVINLGQLGDFPVAGDWNGDGIDTVGVFRPSTGEWFLVDSTNFTNPNPPVTVNFFFGQSGDLPIAGDFDGNGKDGVGVFRSSTGQFFLNDEKLNGIVSATISFGSPGDFPSAGDWNGDGSDGIAVYRPSTGQFFLNNNNVSNVADLVFVFGTSDDLPLSGNWDGIP